MHMGCFGIRLKSGKFALWFLLLFFFFFPSSIFILFLLIFGIFITDLKIQLQILGSAFNLSNTSKISSIRKHFQESILNYLY